MTDLAEWRTHWSQRTDFGKWQANIPTWPKTPLLPSFAATLGTSLSEDYLSRAEGELKVVERQGNATANQSG
jgi:hypothetical protein